MKRLALLLLASCGRLGFDAVRTSDATSGDGSTIDGPTAPADMITVMGTTFDVEPGTPWKRATITHGFFMDRDELTVGRFAAWIAAGRPVPCDGCALAAHYAMHWYSSWNANVQAGDFTQPCQSPWTTNGSTFPTSDPDMPMNCMTWTQAIAVCAYEGKRLATNVEWNLEARGADHRQFAWGDTAADCTHATYDACAFPAHVGSAPSGLSRDGARDLSGSLWEWTWDATSATTLEPSADEIPADSVDWAGLSLGSGDGDNHVISGGEWGEDPTNMDLVNGNHHGPGTSWPGQTSISTVGARCVKDF